MEGCASPPYLDAGSGLLIYVCKSSFTLLILFNRNRTACRVESDTAYLEAWIRNDLALFKSGVCPVFRILSARLMK